MRVRIAASAPPMVIAGSTRCAKTARTRDRQPAQLDGKKQDQDRAQGEVGKRQAEQADHAQQAIVPAVTPLRRAYARRNREQYRHQQRCQGQLQRVWIALSDQARDALVETQRWAQIAMQHAFPVVQILPAQGKIKTVGMAGGLHIGHRRAFAQHLKNGVAGHEMNQKENERDNQPDHWQRVQARGGRGIGAFSPVYSAIGPS